MGRAVGTAVPVLTGLPSATEDALKAIAAAAATSGAVEMFHAVGVTPEAPTFADATGGRPVDRVTVSTGSTRRGTDAAHHHRQRTNRQRLPRHAAFLDRRIRGPAGSARRAPGSRRRSSRRHHQPGDRPRARPARLAAELDELGVEVVLDTCTYYPPQPSGVRGTVMTNSAKWAYYAGHAADRCRFRWAQACADAAVTGQIGVRREITGRWLHGESISGQILRLDEPLSFWGGLTPARERSSTSPPPGRRIDGGRRRGHARFARIVGTPGVLGEALRTGGAGGVDRHEGRHQLVAGAMVAESLYGVDCPVLLVDGETFASLTTGTRVEHAGPVRWLTNGVTGIDDNDYLRRILTADVYDIAVETPLDDAPSLSARTGNRVLLKREDLQPVFSFKVRGAYNKMAKLSPEQRPRSHLLLSRKPRSRVALAAAELGCRAVIVMPVTTPALKVDAVRARGAEVVLHGESYSDAETEAHRLMAEQGLEFVHPFDDPDVIAGQGTIAMELLRQHPARSTLSSSPSGAEG